MRVASSLAHPAGAWGHRVGCASSTQRSTRRTSRPGPARRKRHRCPAHQGDAAGGLVVGPLPVRDARRRDVDHRHRGRDEAFVLAEAGLAGAAAVVTSIDVSAAVFAVHAAARRGTVMRARASAEPRGRRGPGACITGGVRCANVSDDNVAESRRHAVRRYRVAAARAGRPSRDRVHDSRIEGLSRGMTGAAYAPLIRACGVRAAEAPAGSRSGRSRLCSPGSAGTGPCRGDAGSAQPPDMPRRHRPRSAP